LKSNVNGFYEIYLNIKEILTDIIRNTDIDIALKGMIKYLKLFCFKENDKFVPDYAKCFNNYGV